MLPVREILEQGNTKKQSIEEIVKEAIEMNSPEPEEYAAIYARKSTKLENNSLKSQASLAREEIKKRNLFVYDVYEDEESATKYHPMHRPEFKRLLYDAMNGKFKTLVVFRRDRLARKVEDLIDIKNFFKKHGRKIIYSNYGEYLIRFWNIYFI
jgi:DNA invertase Pin-like site-specific DNA recombinase